MILLELFWTLFKIGAFSNRNLNKAAITSVVLVALVLFTPLKIAFGLITLPVELYLEVLVLILIPLAVMEFSKAFGLIRHHK